MRQYYILKNDHLKKPTKYSRYGDYKFRDYSIIYYGTNKASRGNYDFSAEIQFLSAFICYGI